MLSRKQNHTTSMMIGQGEVQMRKQGKGVGRLARVCGIVATALATLAVGAPLAQAAFGLSGFEMDVVNSDGSAASQAGGHPYSVTTELTFNQVPGPSGHPYPDESIRNVSVDLPAGFVGSTTAVPKCSSVELYGGVSMAKCPVGSHVGILEVETHTGGESLVKEFSPLYNVEAPPGVPASFGANVLGTLVYLDASIRSEGDYGVTMTARNTSQTLPLLRTKVTIWGVPADSSHDIQRCWQMIEIGVCDESIKMGDGWNSPHSAGITPKALLTNVSRCDGDPFVTELRAESWAGSTDSSSYTLEEDGSPVSIDGCENVAFEPKMSVVPDSREAGAPTGVEATISVPVDGLESPNGIAQSPLRRAEVVFPEGMSVNASSADGLVGCSEAEAKLGTRDPAQCPEASKLGTVKIETPLLENPLEGSVYLATQGTNPFKSLIAMYVSVADPVTGIVLKLPGKVSPDPSTGQLTATFEDTPQLPFSRFEMKLKGGNRAALVTPQACGTYVTEASLAGWANPDEPVSVPSSFTIDRGCSKKDGFTPGFEAGTTNPVAGKHSPFTLRVTRPDGQQNVAAIETTLPKGVLAKLAGVPLCGEAEAVTGACPQGSQVGTATVGAGAGSNPLYVPQPGKPGTAVYLAGPYKGAPYSLVAMVPAQAGPFDLGNVTVRNAISVDPLSTQVSVKSDPLPQLIQGIPIAYRDIRVDVTRPEFTLNPTSCDPTEVKGTIASTGGASAAVADRFQVAGCERLGFKPKLSIRLSGQVKRGGNPALRAVLKQPKGQANIGKAAVILPKGQLIDNAHINNPCTREQFATDTCPKGSILGRARAFSPLLDQPLEGPVYFRSNGGARQLPDIVADLHGAIDVELVGFIDAVKAGQGTSRVRTRFLGVPDAPVTKFVLAMKGGRQGLLENSVNLCRSKPTAAVKMDGQNGKVHDFTVKVKRTCGR